MTLFACGEQQESFLLTGDTPMATRSTEEARVLVAVGCVALVLFLVFIGVEDCVVIHGTEPNPAEREAFRETLHFWLQMFSGSSWPEGASSTTYSCLGFSLAATVHTMLNIAAGLGVLWILLRVVTFRRKTMELAKLIALRDFDLKAQMQNLMLEGIPPEQFEQRTDSIDRAFDEANRSLLRNLEIILGEREARRVMGAMEEEVAAVQAR